MNSDLLGLTETKGSSLLHWNLAYFQICTAKKQWRHITNVAIVCRDGTTTVLGLRPHGELLTSPVGWQPPSWMCICCRCIYPIVQEMHVTVHLPGNCTNDLSIVSYHCNHMQTPPVHQYCASVLKCNFKCNSFMHQDWLYCNISLKWCSIRDQLELFSPEWVWGFFPGAVESVNICWSLAITD